MLKTIRSTRSAANPKETKSKIGGNNVIGNMVGSGEATNPIKKKFRWKQLSPKFW